MRMGEEVIIARVDTFVFYEKPSQLVGEILNPNRILVRKTDFAVRVLAADGR